ncbi:MAG: marine proteobacterial sortase target protein, partial [Pseudomonadales bacterium]
AMQRALCPDCTPEGRVRQVIFLTDGAVGNERGLFAAIQQRLGRTRLFTVGIGSAPNSHFMRKAAQFGRGSYTYIASTSEVARAMSELFAKIERPVMTDIQLQLDGKVAREQFPSPIADLYYGEPLIATMKLNGPPSEVMVVGTIDGQVVKAQVPVEVSSRSGVHVTWARSKVESLQDRMVGRAEPDAVASLRQALIDIGLFHHMVTPHTSLVAVDVTPVRAADEMLQKKRLANNPPKGTRFGLAQTASPASLSLTLGLVLLCVAFILFRSKGHERRSYGAA